MKEIAEPIPLGKAAVFVLVGKGLKERPFDGLTTGEGVVFFDSYDMSAGGRVRAAFQSERVMGEFIARRPQSKKCRF